MNTNLIESIKKHEGYRAKVYKDSLGIDTIGYGFAIKDLSLDRDICDMILERKVEAVTREAYSVIPWLDGAHPVVFDVIIEMCYQLGVTGVSHFRKTLDHLKHKEYTSASVEMLDSKWARQTPLRARELSARIASLANMEL